MSNLKDIRTQRGYSQRQLAELSGVNLRMIQYYEQGVKDINLAQGITLYKLAQVLECNIEDILELSEIKRNAEALAEYRTKKYGERGKDS